MHHRALTCQLCGRKYFPASLKFHVKVCVKKEDNIELSCDYCNERFPCAILKLHMKFCKHNQRRASATTLVRELSSRDPVKRRSKRGEKNICGTQFGDSPTTIAALVPPEQQQQDHPLTEHALATGGQDSLVLPSRTDAGDDDISSDGQSTPNASGRGRNGTATTGSNTGDGVGDLDGTGKAAGVTTSDDRIACATCNRWFSFDRVGVHEDICVRVNAAAAARRDKRNRGREHTKKNEVRSPPSQARFCRRRSSCPVFSGSNASARAGGARGRFLGRERSWDRNRDAVDDIGSFEVEGGSEREEPRQQSEGRDGRKGGKIDAVADAGNTAATSSQLIAQQQRHYARRPSSATGWSSSSGFALSAETRPARLSDRRAISMSCSPARVRRRGASNIVLPANRIERPVLSKSGRGVGRKMLDAGKVTVGKKVMVPLGRRGIVDGDITREEFVHRVGFFSPSWRVRLLKQST